MENEQPKTGVAITPEVLKALPEFPTLGDVFFAILQTGLRETNWKYKDFPKIQAVEAQLVQLNRFALALQNANKPKPVTEDPPKEDQRADTNVNPEATPEPQENVSVENDKTPTPEANVAPDAQNEPKTEDTQKPTEPTPAEPKKKMKI